VAFSPLAGKAADPIHASRGHNEAVGSASTGRTTGKGLAVQTNAGRPKADQAAIPDHKDFLKAVRLGRYDDQLETIVEVVSKRYLSVKEQRVL